MRWFALVAAVAFAFGCAKERKKAPRVEVQNPGLCSHNVLVSYKLYYEKTTASVRVEFSTDGGTTWRTCTQGTGGEPTENISASPDGVEHTFAWDSLADIQGVSINTLIRVVPIGERKGSPAVAGPFIVNNSRNTAPQVMLLDTFKAGGNLIIKYLAYDEDGDALSTDVEFDCGAGRWLTATQNTSAGGDPISQLPSSLKEENDDSDQLSYWSLHNITLGTHTDSEGFIYVKLYENPQGTYNLELYSDSAMSNLIASTSTTQTSTWLSFTDAITGVEVEVLLNFVGDDTDIKLRCGQVHYAVWDSLKDLGQVFVPNLKVRLGVADSQTEGTCVNEVSLNLDNTADLFEVGSCVTVHIGTNAAACADIDSDGKEEVVAGCASDIAIVHYANPPTYSWLSLNTEVDAVALADVNNDSKPDIIAAGPEGEWLSTDGGSNWQTLQTGTETKALLVCDLNGDGYPEIVTARRDGLLLWLNSSTNPGTFTLATPPISGRGFRALLAADFDGDGDIDIYASSPEGDALFLNDGNGSFSPATLPDGTASLCACALDVDGDADTDILLGRGTTNILLINDGSANFTHSTTLPSQSEKTEAIVTLTRNARTYIALANRGQNRLWVLWDTRLFDATPLNLPESEDVTLCVARGDLNGDGTLDLFFGNLNEDTIIVGR